MLQLSYLNNEETPLVWHLILEEKEIFLEFLTSPIS